MSDLVGELLEVAELINNVKIENPDDTVSSFRVNASDYPALYEYCQKHHRDRPFEITDVKLLFLP